MDKGGKNTKKKEKKDRIKIGVDGNISWNKKT